MQAYEGGSSYLQNFNPLLNAFIGTERPASFDPIAAWYMAHYGTTVNPVGLPFAGIGIPLNGHFQQVTFQNILFEE